MQCNVTWVFIYFYLMGREGGANFESWHCRYHYHEYDGVMVVFTPVIVIDLIENWPPI